MVKFSKSEKEKIVQAIRQAEAMTSGEICVRVDMSFRIPRSGMRNLRGVTPEISRFARNDEDAIKAKAKEVFEKMGMTKTQLRNGVLIYLALKDRTFAILGDAGIHEKVGQNFWDDTTHLMQQDFQAGKFVEGLERGIQSIGEKLKIHFPALTKNPNELSDEIR